MGLLKNCPLLILIISICLNAEYSYAQENASNDEVVAEESSKSEADKIDIQADTFTYSEDGKEVIAKDNVTVIAEEGTLTTDKLIFNQEADKIYAIGNVVFTDKDNNKMYSEEFELTGDFKRGVARKIVVMFADSTAKLRSDRAVKVNEIKLNLYEADYTACTVDDPEDTPAWQLNSDKVEYDAEDESILYTNATFDLYGVPILYTPIFYHSTNPEKPVTGFLMPKFISSGSKGFGVGSGYFWAIDEKQDATLTATYYSKRGLLGGLSYRYTGTNLKTDLYTEGLSDKEDNDHMRGLFRGYAEYVTEPGKRFGINSKVVSDDEYLEEFKDKSDAYLYSTVYSEIANEDTYLGVSSRYYQDLRTEVTHEDVAQPYGKLQFEKLFDVDETNGQIQFTSELLTLQRERGQDTNRLVTRTEYIKPFYTPDGSLFEFRGSLRADYYKFNKHDVPGSKDETETRILPEAAISWEKPYVSNGFKHTISPRVMLVTSPRKEYKDIPNEDSTSFELDTVNLFQLNRFSGWDKIETGTRVVYGLDSKYGLPNDLKFQAFLGQSYNFSVKEEDVNSATSNNNNSDWVGFVKFSPNDHLSMSSSFRLDSSNFATQRIDSGIRLAKESVYKEIDSRLEDDYIRLSHSFLKDDSESLNLYAYYNLNEKFSLKGHVERNLYSNITLVKEVETVYHQGCYNLSFTVRDKQSENSKIEDSLDFLFNFSILPTGK